MTGCWHAEWLWPGVGPVLADVALSVDGGLVTAVEPGVTPPRGCARLAGVTLPGLVNAHSHAFQRALRGRAQGRGDFWSWRRAMYRLAGSLDPDSLHLVARACFAEMACAGITTVGEFHYLHHGPGGTRYDDPAAMGLALARAAGEAGVRLVLLDTCYLRAGFAGEPLDPVQARFSDGDAPAWVARVAEQAERLAGDPLVTVGAAAHSVRALDEPSLGVVAAWAQERGLPLHVHVSEQPGENEACRKATGASPTELLARNGALGPGTTAVHATHVSDDDIALLGTSRTTVALCPTTERDLADGVGPAAALAAAGAPLCVGSDSQAAVDLFEEARAIELDQRLVTGRRGHHEPEALLHAATLGGSRSLGLAAAGLVPGAPADFVTVGLGSTRLAGSDPADLVSHVVFAAAAADVTHVVVAGRPVVADGHHLLLGDVGALLRDAIGAVRS